ncbi:MAG: hypothetical protein ACXWAX_08190, partial [Chthoniobacterales bacterium]
AAIANNFSGVEIYLGSNNTIGGTTGSTRNFISGNNDRGVLIDGANASGNMVQGNTIGLDVTGTARANGNTGVEFFTGSHANTIGGTTIGASNQIASNTNDGIRVYDSGTDGTNMMALLGNSIFSNTALGIDLLYGNNGPQHPNNGQAAPILTSAVLGAAGNVNGTDVSGTLNSTASTTFRIEFFASPGGTGQGKNFIGATNVTTNGAGSAAFASLHLSAAVPIAPVQVGGSVITATATDPNNNTSQFSSPIAVAATDTDSDGIPDAWMNSNFGHPTGQAADKSRASDDADGDGLTNLQEFLAGNDPKSGGSWLHITAIARSGTDRLVTFASATGKTYRIDYKDDITSATWILLQDQLNATSSSTQITDSGAGNLVHRFYRVALEP